MRKVKLLFIAITLFSLGFFANAFLFQKNSAQITALSQTVLSQPSVQQQKAEDQFITYIDYDGNRFELDIVTVQKGNYIAITNKSKEKLMWLVSNNKDFNTLRGYGEGERLQLILQKSGEFKIADKLSGARATIIVKE